MSGVDKVADINIKDESFQMSVKRKGKQGVFSQEINCKEGEDNCTRVIDMNGEKKEDVVSKKVLFGLEAPK